MDILLAEHITATCGDSTFFYPQGTKVRLIYRGFTFFLIEILGGENDGLRIRVSHSAIIQNKQETE